MKKISRILSVALIAAMLLSLSAVALADDTTVYIPAKVSKLGLPDMMGWNKDYTAVAPTHAIYLKTKTESKALGNPCPILAVEDADIDLYFKDADGNAISPDWAGVVWTNGWEDLVIEDGHALTSMEGHPIQPGMWAASGPCDPLTGKPAWYACGGDYPYSGGKTWDDGITVNYNWTRKGKLYKVEYVFENEDFFRTGMEGAKSSIIYECVNVQLDSGKWKLEELTEKQAEQLVQYLTDDTDPQPVYDENGDPVLDEDGNQVYTDYIPSTAHVDKDTDNIIYDGEEVTEIDDVFYRWVFYPSSTDVWYVSQVKATYPAGNYIVGVEADYRNDKKGNLSSYRISYATSDTEVYKITYAPKTTTVVEDHTLGKDKIKYNKVVALDAKGNVLLDLDGKPITYPYTVGSNAPSTKADPIYLHHYTADEPIYGEYYVDGTLVGVSGSGNKLNKWYKPGHGKQIRKPGLKGTTSFTSPRVQ